MYSAFNAIWNTPWAYSSRFYEKNTNSLITDRARSGVWLTNVRVITTTITSSLIDTVENTRKE